MHRRAFIGRVAGGLLAMPLGAHAQQQGKVWRVGFLSPTSASLSSPNIGAFLKGMRELGYVEGKNLVMSGALPMASSNACPVWRRNWCS